MKYLLAFIISGMIYCKLYAVQVSHAYLGQYSPAWRQEALQRIEDIRKGILTIRLVNRYDEPIDGAQLEINMRRHDFGFGTAVSSDLLFQDSENARRYRQELENLAGKERSFNIVTLENALKWPSWENEGLWGTRERAQQAVEWFIQRDIKVRGHNLIWPNWDYLPPDMRAGQHDPEFLKDRIQNHILDEASYPGLSGFIAEWDVLNEIYHNTDLHKVFGSNDIYADCFRWAAIADPQARLYLNENDIITSRGDSTSRRCLHANINHLLRAKTPLHGIGFQGHMGKDPTPPDVVLDILDQFSEYGLEISITEYDAVGANEERAADDMRDLLVAVYSHPQARNFIMWGFWDGAHWKGDSPIFREDWSLKPAGAVFLDLVFEKWWTKTNGLTDENGLFNASCFFGDYEILVSFKDQTKLINYTFIDTSRTLTIKLDTDENMVQPPDLFRLLKIAPNPFNQGTSVHYILPERAPVTIDLYDLCGRRIKRLREKVQAAGRHEIRIDAFGLASGVYYLHMFSGRKRRVEKLLLVR